jgi:hypothetical protein
MKKSLVAATVISVLAAGLTPAWANHRHPPRAILKAPGAWQRGVLATHCWNYSDEGSNEGVGFCADALHGFPEPDNTDADARATIRLWVKKLPKDFSVDAWDSVDQNGQPVGDPTRLVSIVRPHRKDGVIVAYDIRFNLPGEPGHAYLTAFAKWGPITYKDGTADGDAFYDFHVVVE